MPSIGSKIRESARKFGKKVAQGAREAAGSIKDWGKEAFGDFSKAVKIGTHEVRLKAKIAEGGYGYVYKGELANGRSVAVKQLNCGDSESTKVALEEMETLKQLSTHPNIVGYIDGEYVTKKSGKKVVYIVMEFCSKGSLVSLLDKRMGQFLEKDELFLIFKQLVSAVAFMHEQVPPIQHRDLKVENVLFSRGGEVRLCDFGSCTTKSGIWESRHAINEEEERIQKYTTLMYRAPELVNIIKLRSLIYLLFSPASD